MGKNTPTPASTPTPIVPVPAKGNFAQLLSSLTANTSNPYAIPTTTSTTQLTQTSQPDVESMVNGLFQQLVGRYATSNEIKQYGKELLAAEKANPGLYSGETTYQQSGKRANVTGTQLTAGVAPQEFLTQKIEKSGAAGGFAASTTAFDLLTQMARSEGGAA
jgi:hypothetical protein